MAAVAALLLAAVFALARQIMPAGIHPPAATEGAVSVWFSPAGGCTDAIVSELAKAKKNVLVQAYSFTSAPIAQALVDAKARGVAVTLILDSSQRTERYSSATFLLNHQIPTFIDDQHAIAHNKIMIIDGQTIITGSFNFTKSAEQSNAENLLLIRERPLLVKAYEANFREHLGHSEPYTGPVKK
jgi:phosphatidylserine/phosphatidylglycerophosphate/cardiolipin synthase-like enzyme